VAPRDIHTFEVDGLVGWDKRGFASAGPPSFWVSNEKDVPAPDAFLKRATLSHPTI
jgi:hypothetical protein